MCAVSMVLDYSQRTPLEDYNLDSYRRLMEMVEAAKQFDKVNKEPDCEDPQKVEFLKQIIDRLEKIENRISAVEAVTERARVDAVLNTLPPALVPVTESPEIVPMEGIVPAIPDGFDPDIVITIPIMTSVREIPSDDPGTITVAVGIEIDTRESYITVDEADVLWKQKSSGYCPQCGGQWVEAPCASAEHQRRRYE